MPKPHWENQLLHLYIATDKQTFSVGVFSSLAAGYDDTMAASSKRNNTKTLTLPFQHKTAPGEKEKKKRLGEDTLTSEGWYDMKIISCNMVS